MRITNEEAETMFAALRWSATDGNPACPHCGSLAFYEARRSNGRIGFGTAG
jgi:hypothetical protein